MLFPRQTLQQVVSHEVHPVSEVLLILLECFCLGLLETRLVALRDCLRVSLDPVAVLDYAHHL